MKFGIFAAGGVERPWTEGKEAQAIRDEIERGVVADREGFDYFWSPEHHFLEEYSHISSSDIAVLAVGLKTSRIRVATGIFNLCPPINHPIRVAERIALIDILTNGRVDLGTGRGSGSWEVNGFGVSTDESRAMWDEAITAIPKMWTSESFSWQGKYFSMPERNVLPKPVQKPHPPLWVTAGNPAPSSRTGVGTAEIAGRKGIGVCFFSFGAPSLLEPHIAAYRQAIASAEPVGAYVHNAAMTISQLICCETREEAFALYKEHAGKQAAHFARYFDTITERTGLGDRTEMHRRAIEEQTTDERAAMGLCVGTPDDVIAAVRSYEAVGIDQLVFVPTGGVPQDKHIKSLELVGKHVLPKFRK